VCWGKTSPIPEKVMAAVQKGATRALYVGNLAPQITDDVIRQLFGQYGEIDIIVIKKEHSHAFVNMTAIKSASLARQHLNGVFVHGQQLKINFAKEPIQGAGRANQQQAAAMEGVEGM